MQGQSSKLDSLKEVLITLEKDTHQVNLLIKIASEYSNQSPDSSLRYGLMAEAASRKLKIDASGGWKIGIGRSEHTIAIAYFRKSDFPHALEYYFKALSVWEKMEAEDIKHKRPVSTYLLNLKSKTIGNIGLVYWQQSDHSKALKYYFRALKIDEELGNNTGIARH